MKKIIILVSLLLIIVIIIYLLYIFNYIGHKKYKNLSERIYKCRKCNNTLDRDFNSSINIMFEGIKLYMKEVFS